MVGETSIDYDWIKEFLDMSDEERDEDVVVLHEVAKSKSSSISTTPAVKGVVGGDDEEEEEDDCVVLDGDPEKLVTSVNDSPTGSDSDELFLVGEKGQIACRDYPHPRHLCANFPYSSTPHVRHCGQCHCYVCDSPAPCLKWGTGLSSTDHCHATDKSYMWKTLREDLKLGKTASLPASSTLGNVGNNSYSQHNPVLQLDIITRRLSQNSMLMNQTPMSTATHPLSANLIPQNQASQPIRMRTCSSLSSTLQNQVSTASNFPVLHGANHGRCQESGSTLVRNRYHPHSHVPRQFLGVQSHAIQKSRRGRGACSLGPQFLCSSVVNPFTHGASGFINHLNPALQSDRYCGAATGFPNSRTCYYGQNNDVWVNKNLWCPQPSSELTNLMRYETQAHYQSNAANASQNFHGDSTRGNDALSSLVAYLSRNQHLNEHQIGRQNENAHGSINKFGAATMQDACQQKPHGEIESESEYARRFDSGFQSSGSINAAAPNAKESDTLFSGSSNLSVDDIKHWLFDEDNYNYMIHLL